MQVLVVPQAQFCGCGRRCDHAATLGLATEKVPQTQFIAGVGGHSSAHRDGYALCAGMAAMKVFLGLLKAIFSDSVPLGR